MLSKEESSPPIELLAYEVGGRPRIGVAHTSAADSAVTMQRWRFDGSAAAAGTGSSAVTSGQLVSEGEIELVPTGFANPLLAAADLDGDGTDEVVAVYTNKTGNGARVRALDTTSGSLLFDARAFGNAFGSVALVVGDFRPGNEGLEIVVGAQKRGNGKGFLRLLDGDGEPLIGTGRGLSTPGSGRGVDADRRRGCDRSGR